MTAPTTQDRAVDEVATQVVATLHGALWTYRTMMGLDNAASWDPDTVAIDSTASRLAEQLLGDHSENITPGQVSAAQTIMGALWAEQGPPSEWWESPLGLAVARINGRAET